MSLPHLAVDWSVIVAFPGHTHCSFYLNSDFTKFFVHYSLNRHSYSAFYLIAGAQWLSGRVLDSRLRDSGFEPHRRHCVVVLEQDTFILA